MKKIFRLLKDYTIILIGSVIYAFAFDALFVPNNIAMGGFTGIAQIINCFIPSLPIGIIIIVLNVPLFILGIRLMGVKFLFSSVFAMITSSVAIDILPAFVSFRPIEDSLMVCILGGAVVGIGLGLQLLVGATTGGTELAATLLRHKLRHIQIGRICLFIDLCVIVAYAAVFRSVEDAMYAAIAMYVSSGAIDAVIYGRRMSKVACIITEHGDELSGELLGSDLGITEIRAKGAFSRDDKQVLICAFKPNRIAIIKRAVIEYDPNAFVIVCDAQDVYGEGFAECMLNGI